MGDGDGDGDGVAEAVGVGDGAGGGLVFGTGFVVRVTGCGTVRGSAAPGDATGEWDLVGPGVDLGLVADEGDDEAACVAAAPALTG